MRTARRITVMFALAAATIAAAAAPALAHNIGGG
jgi:hypothetical protein